MLSKLEKFTIEDYKITVFLPYDYALNNKYSVIYLNDGNDYLLDQSLIDQLRKLSINNYIIVGITSSNRSADYTPWFNDDLSYKIGSFAGKGDYYLETLVNKVKPYIDKNYPVYTDFNHTAIVGSSLGGLISMYAALHYPETFKYIGCISPSFWYEGFIEYVAKKDLININQAFHFTVGVNEGIRRMNVKRTMVESVHTLADVLIDKRVTNIYVELNKKYNHKITSFQTRLINIIEWIDKDVN